MSDSDMTHSTQPHNLDESDAEDLPEGKPEAGPDTAMEPPAREATPETEAALPEDAAQAREDSSDESLEAASLSASAQSAFPPTAMAEQSQTEVEASSPPARPRRTVAASGSGERFRPTSLAAGGLLIALGVIYLWPLFSGGYILVPAAILAIAALGFSLSLVVHWLNSGRRARGSLFIALLCLLWGLLTGIFLLEPAAGDIARSWPLFLMVTGLGILLTFLGDRRRDRRLILPGTALAVAGLAALTVTYGQLPAEAVAIVREVGPWLLVLLALGLIPLALQRTARKN